MLDDVKIELNRSKYLDSHKGYKKLIAGLQVRKSTNLDPEIILFLKVNGQ